MNDDVDEDNFRLTRQEIWDNSITQSLILKNLDESCQEANKEVIKQYFDIRQDNLSINDFISILMITHHHRHISEKVGLFIETNSLLRIIEHFKIMNCMDIGTFKEFNFSNRQTKLEIVTPFFQPRKNNSKFSIKLDLNNNFSNVLSVKLLTGKKNNSNFLFEKMKSSNTKNHFEVDLINERIDCEFLPELFDLPDASFNLEYQSSTHLLDTANVKNANNINFCVELEKKNVDSNTNMIFTEFIKKWNEHPFIVPSKSQLYIDLFELSGKIIISKEQKSTFLESLLSFSNRNEVFTNNFCILLWTNTLFALENNFGQAIKFLKLIQTGFLSDFIELEISIFKIRLNVRLTCEKINEFVGKFIESHVLYANAMSLIKIERKLQGQTDEQKNKVKFRMKILEKYIAKLMRKDYSLSHKTLSINVPREKTASFSFDGNVRSFEDDNHKKKEQIILSENNNETYNHSQIKKVHGSSEVLHRLTKLEDEQSNGAGFENKIEKNKNVEQKNKENLVNSSKKVKNESFRKVLVATSWTYLIFKKMFNLSINLKKNENKKIKNFLLFFFSEISKTSPIEMRNHLKLNFLTVFRLNSIENVLVKITKLFIFQNSDIYKNLFLEAKNKNSHMSNFDYHYSIESGDEKRNSEHRFSNLVNGFIKNAKYVPANQNKEQKNIKTCNYFPKRAQIIDLTFELNSANVDASTIPNIRRESISSQKRRSSQIDLKKILPKIEKRISKPGAEMKKEFFENNFKIEKIIQNRRNSSRRGTQKMSEDIFNSISVASSMKPTIIDDKVLTPKSWKSLNPRKIFKTGRENYVKYLLVGRPIILDENSSNI